MAKKPTNPLDKAIARSRESKRHIANTIRNLQEHRAVYSAILGCVEMTDKDLTVVDCESVAFCLYDLDSLKDERLMDGLSKVMDLPNIRDRGTQDYPGARNRDFRFVMDYDRSDNKTGRIWISIQAYVKSNSESCRRVQTGVREEPIYELVCD